MTAQNSEIPNYYNAAVQFYNNEIEAIGTRTSTFFLTQSILIAALVIILTNQETSSAAFSIIAVGIILIGFIFCALHTRAGWSGAKGAFTWRRYILHLENKDKGAPWQWFTENVDSKPKDTKDNNSLCQLIKEGNLVKYPPLPSMWVFSPLLFLFLWLGAFIYTIIKYGMESCHQAPSCLTILFIIASVFTLIASILAMCLIYKSLKAWQYPPEIKECANTATTPK